MVKESFFPFQVYPRVPGHEVVGDVVAIGEGEKLWKVGDRVGVGAHIGSCMQCRQCKEGYENYCAKGISTYVSQLPHS